MAQTTSLMLDTMTMRVYGGGRFPHCVPTAAWYFICYTVACTNLTIDVTIDMEPSGSLSWMIFFVFYPEGAPRKPVEQLQRLFDLQRLTGVQHSRLEPSKATVILWRQYAFKEYKTTIHLKSVTITKPIICICYAFLQGYCRQLLLS